MDEYLDLIAPYNFWYGNSLPVGFIRESYTDQLIRYTGNRLIKVLSGQRRVGKSYIMRQIASHLIHNGIKSENTLFINRELSVFDFIHSSDDLNHLVDAYRKKFKPQGKIYIFIDEVQEIKDWERSVNSMSQDYTVDIEVFISGSNSRLLSGELATLISGRYVELSVYPFSFSEFSAVHNLIPDRQAFLSYMQEGGLPELINLPDKDMKQRYMAGLRDSIMLKDIVKRYAIKDIGLLENLLAYAINNSSSLISISGIANYLNSKGSKSSYETIATYLIYLQEAFIIHKSERYNISGKALLAGNFKAYPNDQAYHNYLYPTVRFGNGYILEGIVYMELIRKGYKVNTGVIRDKEIDFIAVRNDRILYVQVSYMLTDEVTAEREYASLEYVKGIGEKFLVTLDDVSYPIRNGVRHIQAWEFHKYI